MRSLNNLCRFSVTATAETVVKKLSKANIAAYNVKKEGNKLTFQVRDEYAKKVFAIFSHPCYNINIRRKSGRNRLHGFALNRIGLIVGACAFIAAAIISNSMVLKISVTGSGSYLKSEVEAIVLSSGVKRGSFYKGVDKPLMQAKIMTLPNVTFCSVEKLGSTLIIDVQTDEEHSQSASYSPLISDASGKITNIVAICGTAEAEIGQTVKKGKTLIGAYSVNPSGERSPCMAVGYVSMECTASIDFPAAEESEENKNAALNSALLYSDAITQKSCTVKRSGEGVIYSVTFTYVHTQSINME